DAFNLLLVDSENPVSRPRLEHLRHQDGWDVSPLTEVPAADLPPEEMDKSRPLQVTISCTASCARPRASGLLKHGNACKKEIAVPGCCGISESRGRAFSAFPRFWRNSMLKVRSACLAALALATVLPA